MKGKLLIVTGLIVALSFLAPAVLSQGASNVNSYDRGTAIQSASRDSSAMIYEGIGGVQSDSFLSRENGSSHLMTNATSTDSSRSSGDIHSGRNGYPCLGVSGGTTC